MKKKIFWIIILTIIILLILIAVFSRDKGTDLSEISEIKIGSILIQTGDGASWGEAALNGIELAVSELNEKGGILGKKVVTVHENDEGDPAKAVGAFRKLTQTDNIKFIIGTNWSVTGLPLIELVTDEIVISPSLGKAEFNESSDYIFNTWMHDYILSEGLAQHISDKGYKNIVILGANEVWVKEQTTAVKNKFEELGGTVSYVFEPTVDQRDLRTDLLKIKNMPEVEAIVITTDGYGITSIYGRQMQELEINQPVYAITLDKTVIENCLGACNGWEHISALTPTEEFETKYKARYSREVEIGADSAYDAVMLIAEAIEKTESINTNDIQKYLNNIDIYEGASGTLTSDGVGGFTKKYKTLLIENGLFVELK
jgi:branched-chain amino acid transport system substrate-binding protein